MHKDFITSLLMRWDPAFGTGLGTCFADDGGEGGGSTDGQKSGQGDDDPGQSSGGDEGRKTSGDQKPKEKTVPESAHLDRLARAKRKAKEGEQKRLFQQHGVNSEEELAELVTKAREGESELDRLRRENEQLSAGLAERDQKLEVHRKEKAETSILQAVTGAIEAEGKADKDGNPGRQVTNMSQVQKLLRSSLDYRDGKVVVVDANGDPDHGKNVKKLVKGFLDENEHFVKSTIPSGGAGSRPLPNAQGSPPQGPDPATKAGREARYQQMAREGKFK